MIDKKIKLTVRTKPEVFCEIERRSKEEKKTVNELINKILEKYVAESHQKWFEKDTQFVGRLWKKIEIESVETRKNLFDLSKAVLSIVQMFRTISSTKEPMEDALKKINLELDRINFLSEENENG